MTAIESAVVTTSSAWIGDGEDYTAGKLTTTFTYNTGCAPTRWQYYPDTTGSEQSMVVFTLNTECQPMTTYPVYSPGLCPEGMTIATVVENRHSNYTKGGSRMWNANCCSS
jgi:hypothetical protein